MGKRCCICKKVKPIEDFHINKSRKDGHQGVCKNCKANDRKNNKSISIYMKDYREKHSKENSEYMKKYRQNNRERLSARDRIYPKTETGKEVRNRAMQKYRQNNPVKVAARVALNIAIRAGKIPSIKNEACVECNKQAKHYHHHKGYDPLHWLDVVPVCAICHKAIENK